MHVFADLRTLNELHWDPSSRMYLDWGLHTEDAKLDRRSFKVSHVGRAMLPECCYLT